MRWKSLCCRIETIDPLRSLEPALQSVVLSHRSYGSSIDLRKEKVWNLEIMFFTF